MTDSDRPMGTKNVDGANGQDQIPQHRLDNEQVCLLIDILRRNFWYQNPELLVPKVPSPKDDGWIILRLRRTHYPILMQLLDEAGGWVITDKERKQQRIEDELRDARDKGHEQARNLNEEEQPNGEKH